MKCPRCKSENINFQKKNDYVGFLTNDTFTKSRAVCQDCGKTFDPDIAYYESNMTADEKAWSRGGFIFLCIMIFSPLATGVVGFAVGLIGMIFCMVKGAKAKKKRK